MKLSFYLLILADSFSLVSSRNKDWLNYCYKAAMGATQVTHSPRRRPINVDAVAAPMPVQEPTSHSLTNY